MGGELVVVFLVVASFYPDSSAPAATPPVVEMTKGRVPPAPLSLGMTKRGNGNTAASWWAGSAVPYATVVYDAGGD